MAGPELRAQLIAFEYRGGYWFHVFGYVPGVSPRGRARVFGREYRRKLEAMYLEEEMSLLDISDETGFDSKVISRILKESGIDVVSIGNKRRGRKRTVREK